MAQTVRELRPTLSTIVASLQFHECPENCDWISTGIFFHARDYPPSMFKDGYHIICTGGDILRHIDVVVNDNSSPEPYLGVCLGPYEEVKMKSKRVDSDKYRVSLGNMAWMAHPWTGFKFRIIRLPKQSFELHDIRVNHGDIYVMDLRLAIFQEKYRYRFVFGDTLYERRQGYAYPVRVLKAISTIQNWWRLLKYNPNLKRGYEHIQSLKPAAFAD